MLEYPLYVPVKTLESGMKSAMFVTNIKNDKNYLLTISFEPAPHTLDAIGFDNTIELKSEDDLLKLYNGVVGERENDIEGVMVYYSDDNQQYVSLR